MTAKILVRQDRSDRWASVNPTLSIGEFGYETDTGKMKMGDGATAWTTLTYYIGGFNSYTPTLVQGASTNIAKTVNYSKYSVAGKLVSGSVKLTSTATGTAASAITISLPKTAAASGIIVGGGFYNDGGTQYQAIAYLATTTTLALLSTHGTAGATTDDPIGVNPNIAVASGDIFNVNFSYEAA